MRVGTSEKRSRKISRRRQQARLKKGDYEKAVADATKAIELSILNVDAYKARAEAYRKTGKTALAEADEKNALKFEKDFKESQEN